MVNQTISNPPALCTEGNAVIDPYYETISPLNYSVLNSSIQETFTAIDRFEWQASDELVVMRDNRYYRDGAYLSFENYCENELTKYGGYRRVRDLLAAKKVVDTLSDELKDKITKPSQTRPLLRLVKTPDKLREAVAIAAKEKAFPTAADFAKAVSKVAPRAIAHVRKDTTVQDSCETQLCQSVRVSSQLHPRYGDEGVIEADAPNNYQQIVTFNDRERLLVNNADLTNLSNDAIVSFKSERTYPKEYANAIAQLKQEHQQELERLEQELRIGLQTEAAAKAEQQVQEQLAALQKLFQQQKQENIQLQQRLDELEGLRQLELENQRLQQRIHELERAVEERPAQEWSNTLTKQATKALNKGVKQALDQTIDLRSLAQEPPKENAQECLRLMGIALSNLATAMNNTQALQAAAIILGSEPTPQAIAYRTEQLQLLPQAVSDIRAVLSKPGCSWQNYLDVAREYEVIKSDYWAELTPQETELITALEKTNSQPSTIRLGSIVAHADPYFALYVRKGEVIEDLGSEVVVAWDHWKDRPKKTDRYFKNDLRLL
ncbi:hypothetical protein [Dendronalium sp. ChiSLP03b]|uniref:hypothetical protein n=1 Tax=Dendronalium sp. ChiSLP03b TaxID=3075381 RepID=UPI002AD49500|nr:hypothetical protein [Dendronalium sp. ChiSLP03b]MDZ8209336.1 hypothetical protein [Dendronalium sp. ChiSLP03b]